MNKLDLDYQNLIKDILENGVEKDTRNGKVLSVFGRTIRYKFRDGKFPLLTTKKMAWKSVVTELLWFLNGKTDLRWLLDRDNTIWVGDAYKRYRSFNHFEPGNIIKSNDSGFEREVMEVTLSQEEFINKIKTDNEFAEKWGSLGKIYGHGWRNWNGKSDDELYEDYLKKVKKIL